MPINLTQLIKQPQKSLSPIYLLTGDEPWQMQQAHTFIIQQAQQQGATRQRFDIGTSFNWASLTTYTQNVSLFSELQLLDLVISGKLGKAGSEFIRDYATNPSPDTILLLRMPKLDQATLRSKWVQAIEKIGIIVQIWPITSKQIPSWLSGQLKQAQLTTDKAGLQLLTEHIEGNLAAGAQAIEKLSLLYSQGQISAEKIAHAIHDTAQYDVFQLVDACLQHQPTRSLRILTSLREEGSAPTIILWALARELRTLATMAFALQSVSLSQVLQQARVWQNRKALVTAALKKLTLSQLHYLLEYTYQIDCSIKGYNRDDPWEQLSHLCLWLTQPGLIRLP